MLSCVARGSRQAVRGIQTRSLAMPALHTPLPSAQAQSFVEGQPRSAKVTKLDSGVQVVTVEQGGNASTIGITVDVGSRQEDSTTTGCTHVMQMMSFKASQGKTTFRTTREMERMGAAVHSYAYRDALMFTGHVVRPAALDLFELISRTVVSPTFNHWEVQEAATRAAAAAAETEASPPMYMGEMLQNTAYGHFGLGQPVTNPAHVYSAVSPDALKSFWSNNLSANGIFVAGVNVDHDALVGASKEMFQSVSTIPRPALRQAVYVGGYSAAQSTSPLTAVGVAFDGVSWKSKDIAPMSVLTTILGGGEHFSSGGPGKGMFSRVYSKILTAGEDIRMAVAQPMFFADGGLLSFVGFMQPNHAAPVIQNYLRELNLLTKPVGADELKRAKNLLKAQVVNFLDDSEAATVDAMRQIQAYDRILSTKELFAMIDGVTAEQVAKVAATTLQSAPTICVYGDTRAVPSWTTVDEWLQVKL